LRQYPDLVQRGLCETKEGLNSMYIDAVAKIAAASSYSDKTIKFKVERYDAPNVKKLFAKIEPE
jgi:hypothetical protein